MKYIYLFIIIGRIFLFATGSGAGQTLRVRVAVPTETDSYIVESLNFGAGRFNSLYPGFTVILDVFPVVQSGTAATSCPDLIGSLSEPADAFIDTTSDFYIPHLVTELNRFYVKTNKASSHLDIFFSRCTERQLTAFMSGSVWAKALVDLAVATNWTRLALVFPKSNAFANSIATETITLAHEQNLMQNLSVTSIDLSANHLEAVDSAFQTGSKIVILIAPFDIAAAFINEAASTPQGYQFQYIWLNSEEGQDMTSLFASLLKQSSRYSRYGILALQSVPVGDNSVASLKASIATTSPLPEEAILAYNALMALGQIMKAVVEAGGDKANASQLFQAAQTVSLQNMLGEFKIRGHQKVGPLYLSNLAVSSSSQRTWTSVATWYEDNGYSFSRPLNQLIWFDGSNVVPASQFPKSIIIGIAAPGENPIYKQWNYAAQVALQHINQANLLPGYEIVLQYINSSNSGRLAAERMIAAVAGSRMMAVVGGLLADEVFAMQHILSAYKIPQLAPVVSTSELNDRTEYPYFIRMNALFEQQIRVMIAYWRSLGHRTVGLCRAPSPDGLYASDALNKAVLENNMTVLTRQPYSNTIKSILDAWNAVTASGSRLIFIPGREHEFAFVLPVLKQYGYISPEWAYFFSDRGQFLDETPNGTKSAIDGFMSIGIYPGGGAIYDKFMADFNAIVPQQASNKTAIGVAYVYDAVFTVVRAVKKLTEANETIDSIIANNLLYKAIQNVSFTGATGSISFTNGNRRNNTINIINRVNGAWKTVALAQAPLGMPSAQSLSIIADTIWIGNTTKAPVDILGAFIAWKSEAGTALAIIASLMLLCFAGVALIVIFHRNNKLIRASSPDFLIYVLVGLTLAVCSIFVATSEPSTVLCTLRVWFFVLGFALAYGGLMIKNWRIYRLWSVDTITIVKVTNFDLATYSAVSVLPFLIVLIFWTIFDAPTMITFPSASGSTSACSYVSPSSLAPSIVTFVLIAIMLLAGCVLAFFTRNVPHLYNECRYIALSTYALALCVVLGLVIHFVLAPISSLASFLVFSVAVVFGFGTTFVALFIPKIWIMMSIRELSIHSSLNSGKKVRNLESIAQSEFELRDAVKHGPREPMRSSMISQAGSTTTNASYIASEAMASTFSQRDNFSIFEHRNDSIHVFPGSMTGHDSVMREDERM